MRSRCRGAVLTTVPKGVDMTPEHSTSKQATRRVAGPGVLAVFLLASLLSLLCSVTVSADPEGGNRVVFATSVTGTGDLGSWPDAGGATGLAAGDAICQARATAAGLANPSSFVGWLSDSSNDAYCRVHNFSGVKSANCGQPSLPVAAGPWIRTDGFPFGEAIDQLLSPDQVVYTAIQLDELGRTIPAFSGFFTATNVDGTFFTIAGTCGDWTTTSGDTTAGWESRTSGSWTNAGGGQCATANRLVCLETLSGPPLPPLTPPTRLAFATSVRGNGELGSWPEAGLDVGVAAGDAICQALATAAGLDDPSTFIAWLSDGTTDAIDRIVHDGPWQRPDGVQVAASKADLVDGILFAPINVTEQGDYLDNWAVWSGTNFTGSGTGVDCGDWFVGVAGTDGTYGANNDFRVWTQASQIGCDFGAGRLYCLSDAPTPIFSDGFESGDTSMWSVTVP